jgi:hypothetical protein
LPRAQPIRLRAAFQAGSLDTRSDVMADLEAATPDEPTSVSPILDAMPLPDAGATHTLRSTRPRGVPCSQRSSDSDDHPYSRVIAETLPRPRVDYPHVVTLTSIRSSTLQVAAILCGWSWLSLGMWYGWESARFVGRLLLSVCAAMLVLALLILPRQEFVRPSTWGGIEWPWIQAFGSFLNCAWGALYWTARARAGGFGGRGESAQSSRAGPLRVTQSRSDGR